MIAQAAEAAGPSDLTLVIIAAIAAVPATIAAWQARAARVQATGANQAVNDVGPDQPKLRVVVSRIDERSEKLERQVRRLFADRNTDLAERQARQETLDARLDALVGEIQGIRSDVAPVLADFRRSHPEARPDLDDDSGQT